jgi:hypothetical protein
MKNGKWKMENGEWRTFSSAEPMENIGVADLMTFCEQ